MKPGCTGPCLQGRQSCPTPTACEVGGDEPEFYGAPWVRSMLVDAILVCGLVGLIVLIVLFAAPWTR